MTSRKIRFTMLLAVSSVALQTAAFAPQSSNKATLAAMRAERGDGSDPQASGSASPRRRVLRGLGTAFAGAAGLACAPAVPPAVAAGDNSALDAFFAQQMASDAAQRYERRAAPQKSALFAQLLPSAQRVLEIGVGTGPNLRYSRALHTDTNGFSLVCRFYSQVALGSTALYT